VGTRGITSGVNEPLEALAMKRSTLMVLVLALATGAGHAQNTQVTWSVFSSACGEVSSENIHVLAMTGQPFAGEAGGSDKAVFTGFLADPTLSGIVTAIGPGGFSERPAGSELLQNYPNPFNPSTSITYVVGGPAAQMVRLSVFDLLGREVAVLVHESRMPGRYAVTWEAAHLPSGVYVSRMSAGDHVAVKRMMLLK
jgi:hypothetical protein